MWRNKTNQSFTGYLQHRKVCLFSLYQTKQVKHFVRQLEKDPNAKLNSLETEKPRYSLRNIFSYYFNPFVIFIRSCLTSHSWESCYGFVQVPVICCSVHCEMRTLKIGLQENVTYNYLLLDLKNRLEY